jgi:uncharacterized protein YbjT (DUF2867 family)
MNAPILVTGGTGVLGRVVVERLRAAGRETRVASRRPAPANAIGRAAPDFSPDSAEVNPQPDSATMHRSTGWATVDLSTGAGLAEALAGVETVVHCATSMRAGPDIAATRQLVAAAAHAGVAHLIYVSIVGVDQIPLGYYGGKLTCERIVEESGVPHTILRATQFHDLLRALFATAAKMPVMFVPAVRFQPVDVSDVAARLVELASGEPLGRAPDIGGPEIRPAVDLARAYLDATGRRRPIVPISLPGKLFRALRDGSNLAPDNVVSGPDFARYLSTHPAPARVSYRPRR